MKAKFTMRARVDLFDIWEYIAVDNVDAADRFQEEIVAAASRLAEYPRAGRQREELGADVRSFSVRDYLLLYREASQVVEILRIIHGARDIKAAFEE